MSNRNRPVSTISDKRPDSGSSRSAWNDDGLDAPGRPISGGSESGSADTRRTTKSAASSRGAEKRKKSKKPKKENFCTKIISSIWSTRHTQELTDNETKAKTVLRELIIYIIFLGIICAVTVGMTYETMYTMTKVMTDLMVDSQFPDTQNTFGGMLTQTDFWRFAESPMLDGLYWEKDYNQQNVSESERGYVYYESKLLGVPRLRQLRVHNTSCKVATVFKDVIPACYGEWSKSNNDKTDFGPDGIIGTAWTYHEEKEINGSSHRATLSTYPGSGFYQDLGATRASTAEIIANLKKNQWLDRGTRVVFLDFTIYNPNVNLFTVAKMLVEYPPSGGALPSHQFTTVKLLRYVSVTDYIIMGCEFVFILYILYYLIEEIIEMKNQGCKNYFTEFWNLMDVVVIVIALVCIGFNIYRTLTVEGVIDGLLSSPEKFPDFETLSYWQMQFNYGVALTAFFAWGKLFKYISFNKTMTQLTDTISQAKKDLGSFLIMFFIVFFAFAQVGYLLFGTQVSDYRSIGNVLLTQLRIILGDFNFYELESTHSVLGPLYFIFYIVFVFFILFNMFLAIINDTYSSVKEQSADATNEFEVMDFFKGQYNRMLQKLNIKRDRIADIQDAIVAADANNDSQIEYEEWKAELLARGYKEDEIEEAFKKFDLDGNRVLDAEEQAAMLKALEDEKNLVNKDIGQVEHKLGVNESRPTTARPGTTRAKTGRGARGRKSVAAAAGEEQPPETAQKGKHGKGAGRVVSEVAYVEFTQLSRRVDRMETSIGSIVSKIDTVLVKLEGMEKAKLKRREAMTQLLDSIAESDDASEEMKREQMERLVREELERWDSESAISRPASAASRPGTSMSRPRTGMR